MRTASRLAAATLLFVASLARSQSSEICAPTDDIAPGRHLRQLSLDLWGRIPTEAEYDEVEQSGAVSEALIDRMFEHPDFYAQLRRYHRGLLWGSLATVPHLVDPKRRIHPKENGLWYADDSNQHRRYRGPWGGGCLDQLQTEFDEDGRPVPLLQESNTSRCNGTCTREGYVRVRPYWDPDTEIKVCAYNAQAHSEGVLRIGNRFRDCRRREGLGDPGCGCGPDLERCLARTHDSRFRRSLVEEPLRIFEWIVRERRPYFDALKVRKTFVNGTLSHFYRHHMNLGSLFDVDLGTIPVRAYDDGTWAALERGPMHSGVLTTYLFLQRFASDRSRANRFYTAFLCQPFVAGEETLPAATDPCSNNPDLSQRCGCANCHATLEPAAAHWGRWRTSAEYGYLTPALAPDFLQRCADCEGNGCRGLCDNYYVTRENANHPEELRLAGTFFPTAWRTEAEKQAVVQGPRRLAALPQNMPLLARCASTRLAEHLISRPLTAQERTAWLPKLQQTLESSDYDFLALLKAIVLDERYRRIR